MRCCMVYDFRSVVFKYFEDFSAVTDGTDNGIQLQIRIFLSQFLLNVVGIVFVNIK